MCRAIHSVSKELCKLRAHYIYMPRNADELSEAINDYYEISRFPKVVGTVDCTHVPILSPGIFQTYLTLEAQSYMAIKPNHT